MNYYLESGKAVLDEIASDKNGLNSAEAASRLEKYGHNKLAEQKKQSIIVKFLSQFADPMIIFLLVAAVISGITSAYAHESFTDVFVILFVVILNAVMGVIQESKAEKAIDALKQMTAATCKVMRDGKVEHIKNEDLVPGDIVLLEAGDSVPADCRILESYSLKIEESALTGESVPVDKFIDIIYLRDGEKDVPLGDRKNMAYMGSTVVYGRGTAVVTSTGMNTEMGKIADALTQAEDETTPLQKKLNQLSKILTVMVVGICIFIFVFGLIKTRSFSFDNIIDTFMIAVSLAVAAIPEGLAAVVTIVLSIGVTKMSKRNAVIRKLTAVETLGCTQIICSDKTGTLTQNVMTVVESYSNNEKQLATALALCSDAEIDSDGKVNGEPTEAALVSYANSIKLNKNILKESQPRIGEVPFDSMRKMMTTVHNVEGALIQYTKGAPDEILKKCTHFLDKGTVSPLTDEKRKEILAKNKEFADKALRVLAAGFKKLDSSPDSYTTDLENGLTFIGLVGMIDPVRPEVKAAIDECNQAGIRAIMITGDHKDTAVAIAKQLGIITDASQAITGAELNDISDEDFETLVEKYSVYARVQPEHKVRIVKAWRKKGMVTAMTGDGVNDAPSIKSADIGIGMGITGTDVTKNVADMILADDNFATIVAAVEEGRRIYDNIKKSIQFLLSSNLSEVVSVFVATLFGFTIMKPIHLLWINLITDSLPALALSMEPGEKDLMTRKPRKSSEGIFSNGVGFAIAYQGLIVSILTLAAYIIGHFMESGRWEITNSPDGITMAFLTMSMAEIFHSFNMRSQNGSIFTMKHQNFYLFGSMVVALILTAGVIYIPFFANLFDFTEISLKEYFVAMGLAITIIPIVEFIKIFQRIAAKRRLKNEN
ncbi:MAG: calcium-translocating P-type ATPase, PMCA-type [Ruminococcaceae bacterium]|nr:calcium-translocating P-type ATPase, PMCA-type [Oscillospiraceae bacterium]